MSRRLPWFRLLAVGQVALLARKHVQRLTPVERRRLVSLLQRVWKLDASERAELRKIVRKLQPRAFAVGAADRFSAVPLPNRLKGRSG